ncbi:MAG: hypothetical protein LBU32_26795 [Clostridiales bacterium]|jgi:hypothetical protein|nr:hypothetical protein [Clostridiales bacterium]
MTPKEEEDVSQIAEFGVEIVKKAASLFFTDHRTPDQAVEYIHGKADGNSRQSSDAHQQEFEENSKDGEKFVERENEGGGIKPREEKQASKEKKTDSEEEQEYKDREAEEKKTPTRGEKAESVKEEADLGEDNEGEEIDGNLERHEAVYESLDEDEFENEGFLADEYETAEDGLEEDDHEINDEGIAEDERSDSDFDVKSSGYEAVSDYPYGDDSAACIDERVKELLLGNSEADGLKNQSYKSKTETEDLKAEIDKPKSGADKAKQSEGGSNAESSKSKEARDAKAERSEDIAFETLKTDSGKGEPDIGKSLPISGYAGEVSSKEAPGMAEGSEMSQQYALGEQKLREMVDMINSKIKRPLKNSSQEDLEDVVKLARDLKREGVSLKLESHENGRLGISFKGAGPKEIRNAAIKAMKGAEKYLRIEEGIIGDVGPIEPERKIGALGDMHLEKESRERKKAHEESL